MSLLKTGQSEISPLGLQNMVHKSESQQTAGAALYGNAPSTITASTFPGEEKWEDIHLAALSNT